MFNFLKTFKYLHVVSKSTKGFLLPGGNLCEIRETGKTKLQDLLANFQNNNYNNNVDCGLTGREKKKLVNLCLQIKDRTLNLVITTVW